MNCNDLFAIVIIVALLMMYAKRKSLFSGEGGVAQPVKTSTPTPTPTPATTAAPAPKPEVVVFMENNTKWTLDPAVPNAKVVKSNSKWTLTFDSTGLYLSPTSNPTATKLIRGKITSGKFDNGYTSLNMQHDGNLAAFTKSDRDGWWVTWDQNWIKTKNSSGGSLQSVDKGVALVNPAGVVYYTFNYEKGDWE